MKVASVEAESTLRGVLDPGVYAALLAQRKREQFLIGQLGYLPEWGEAEIGDDYRPDSERGLDGPLGGE